MATQSSASGERQENTPMAAVAQESHAAYSTGLSELQSFADEDAVRRQHGVIDTPEHLLRGMRLILTAGELAYDAVEACDLAVEANQNISATMQDTIPALEESGIDVTGMKQSVVTLEQQDKQLVDRMFQYRNAVDDLGNYFNALGRRYWEIFGTRTGAGGLSPYMGHC